MATATKKFPDADLVHQLGQVLDVAFLYAGFVPYGVQPPFGHVPPGQPRSEAAGASLCFCHRYTAPQLAHHDDAEAAVLLLCAAPGCRDVALVVFLTKARDMRGVYLERLDVTSIHQALSSGRRRSRISRNLADGVCRGLLDKLRRRNGLTLPGFLSLPDDAKVQVLKSLPTGFDLASVECTCRDLRRLVSEHDGELWRHMARNEDWPLRGPWRSPVVAQPATYLRDHVVCTYNLEKLVQVRGLDLNQLYKVHNRLHIFQLQGNRRYFVPVDVKSSGDRLSWKAMYVKARNRYYAGSYVQLPSTPLVWCLPRQKPEDADTKTGKIRGGHHKKAPWNTYNYKDNKSRGAGAVHTPSARYRWRHR